ncbi:ABC transporter substrate-binding protein [Calothrix rhizosoleniae]|uniref:ABC transporter substrate-binding protein n=1 Tax=Calothrix rhizosoleniae TaxID=888997 RepID=UPI000B4A3624|nr:iron-siderophore ABC transporter substrate-binding protein [Calothrix rhizosoleniae]
MATQNYIFRFWQRFIQFIQTSSIWSDNRSLNRQRRFILFMVATNLVVSACGKNIAQTNNKSETSASKVLKPVQHALGETKVPVNPTKIVVLDLFTAEAIISLGIQPVGASGIIINNLLHLQLDPSQIIDIGHPRRPNVEKILALKPDLILTSKMATKPDTYEMLSKIAPTVVFDIDSEAQWQKLTSLCADVLGKQAEEKKLLQDYEAKLQKLKAQLSNEQKPKGISVVYFYPKRIWAFGKDTFSGSILEAAELSRPRNQAKEKGIQISPELLNEIDADALFVLKPRSQSKIAVDIRNAVNKIKNNPLWSKLNVVKTNQVYEVDAYWYGLGYIAANLVLDDLFKYLVMNK